MNVLRPVRLLICLGFLLASFALSAQTATCDDPGNFSITPPPGTSGSGTAADPWVMCTDAILTFGSEGVNPTLGLPNPGLGYMLYNGQPTVQDNVLGDPSASLLIFAMPDGTPVLDNGTAAFPFGLLPGTFTIVPVIISNVNVMPFEYQACTGIDLNGNYPVVTFVDPAVNPDCSVGCTADIGSISTEDNTTFCTSQEVPPNDINVTAEGLSGSLLLYVADAAGNIIAGPYTDGFVVGTDFSQTAEIYGVAYQGDFPPQVTNISELPSGECGALSTTSIPVTWLEANSGSPVTADPTTICAGEDNQITATATGSSGDLIYLLADGDSNLLEISDDGVFTIPAGDVGTCLIYTFAFVGQLNFEPGQSVFELSTECSSLSFDPITINKVDDVAICGDDCIADAGSIPTLEDNNVCGSEVVIFLYDGEPIDGYLQFSLIVTPDGIIQEISDGLHSADAMPPGPYTGYTLSVEAGEGQAVFNWPGLSFDEQIATLTCFDLNMMEDTIFILESVEATIDVSCSACSNTAILTVTIPGATGEVDISGIINGVQYDDVQVYDGSVTIEVENTEPTLDWSIDFDADLVCANAFAQNVMCDTEVDCATLTGGVLSTDDPTTFCLDDDSDKTITVLSEGSNGCGIVYLLTDENGSLIALPQADGTFDFNGATEGVCFIYAMAYGDENPPLLELGTLISELPDQGCFGVSENSIEVIRQQGENCGTTCVDPEIFDVTTICNPDSIPSQLWIFTVTEAVFYEIEGAPATQVNAGEIQLAIDPGTPFEFTFTNGDGCSTTFSSENDVDLGCGDTTDCEAEVGTVVVDVLPGEACLSNTMQVSTVGGNDDYVTYYVLIDLGLFIVDLNSEGGFEVGPGTYSVNVINIPVEEDDFDLEALIGTFSLDFFESFNCSDLFTVNEPVVVEDWMWTYEEFCDFDTVAMATVVLISSNLEFDDVTVTVNGEFETLVTFGNFFDIPITPGEPVNLSWVVDDNCTGAAEIAVAGNPCGDPPMCDAVAGTLSADAAIVCSGESVTVSLAGSNEEYDNVFLLWENGNVIAVNQTGTFAIASGSYSLSSLNLPEVEPPFDIFALMNPEANFDCFAASNVVDVVILTPVVVSHDYACDESSGTFEVTYSFSGGLPSYVEQNGSTGIDGELIYTSTGDLNSEVFLGENFTVEYSENQTYSVTATDALSCNGDVSFTPDPCTKTAIELYSFRAEAEGSSNMVHWSTASEGEGDEMILQYSENGNNFKNLYRRISGGSNIAQDYQYEQENVSQTLYYRLMTIDAQGTTTSSRIVSVERMADDLATIYPNPVNEVLFIADIPAPALIVIFDLSGRVVYSQRSEGSEIQLDMIDYPAGLYHMSIQYEQTTEHKRLLKN